MRGDYHNTKEPKRGGVKYMIVTRKKSSSPSLVINNDRYLNWLQLTLHEY